MSKRKQFHNLIEQGKEDEKSRVWQKIREKDVAQSQNEPTVYEVKPKKAGVFFTRKFAAWTGVIALALIFSAVGFTQILLNGQIERPGGNADMEAMPNVSDDLQEESNPETFSPDNETTADDSDEDNAASPPSGNQGNQDDQGDQDESGEPSFGGYYTSADYTPRELSTNLKQYDPDLLYFETLYENACLTFVYETNADQTVVYLQENYAAPGLQGNVILYITEQTIAVEDLLAYENHPEAKTKNVNGVTIQYHITELADGVRYGYAFFLYQGHKYYVTVTEDGDATVLNETYLLALITELLA